MTMKVSVLVLAYNHERFIAQALDGALLQEVDFPYEIVVGEDCSTDSTRRILRDYQERFPDRIRLLLPERNLGMMGNFMATFKECRGDYIAMLEGDDYWTAPDKLQRQVDFLDAHPECCASFHNARVVHDAAPERDRLFHEAPLAKTFFGLDEVASSHFIPTCSTLFRRGLYPGLPEWFRDMPMGDWPLHILNAEHGSYAYLDRVMASYRVHGGGAWSGSSRLSVIEKTIKACDLINLNTGGRYSKAMARLTRNLEIEAAEIFKDEGDFARAWGRLKRAFRISPASCGRTFKSGCRLLSAWLWCGCLGKGAC